MKKKFGRFPGMFIHLPSQLTYDPLHITTKHNFLAYRVKTCTPFKRIFLTFNW